jgi:hypothetical protein
MKIQTAQQMQATESKSLEEGPDDDAKTADYGCSLYNRLDALRWLLEVLSCRSGRQRPGSDTACEIRVWEELGFLKPI